jgi:adenine-specific DNA-methyltransferase
MPVGNREQKFFSALRDVFVGAKVQGESGYINLMRIKSRYYEKGVFPELTKDINAALKPFPPFREELFDKLYTFFSRYFSESGSIYFRYTPLHQNVYEKVYTDDKDVMLFWKTHMLYYVKTDRLFQNLDVELDGQKFFFDVSGLEHKKANEKRELIYAFKEKRKDGVLTFTVAYSERGRKTNTTDILRALKQAGANVGSELLERAFRVFERQSEVDYFINKNAKAFLEEQFNLWLYQYVFTGESAWTEQRIRQLQVLKDIAFKIIAFISQFEDELVKIWNKPKFVLNSNYVITLSKIAEREGGMAIVEKLLAHPNFKAQVEEWRDLGIVNGSFKKTDVLEKDLTGKRLTVAWRHLPVDTKHFKDVELEILGLFDNLDESLDGWLIKSENYQALNTILPKFRGKVKCTYIDPPYNAEGSEILYVNDYRSSSWLTLLENRLAFVSEFLESGDVGLAVAVDDFEMAKLVQLLKEKFTDFDVNPIVVNHHPQGSPKANLSRTHEYCIVVTPKSTDFVKVPRLKDRPDERPFMRTGTGENNFRRYRQRSFYAIIVDPRTGTIKGLEAPPSGDRYPKKTTEEGFIRVYPIDSSGQERVWRKTYTSAVRAVKEDVVFCRMREGRPSFFERVSIERVKPTSNWFDSKYNAGTHGTSLLTSLFGESGLFSYPKSIHAVADMVDAITYDDDEALTLDFFGGSGTTAHAVINLNRDGGGTRKYLLVEMANYFDTVLLPRVKKVVFTDKWEDGDAKPGKGVSHFMKYYQLEQYEDALRRVKYDDADLFSDPSKDAYNQYVFLRDLKMLEALEVDTKKNKVKVDLSKLYDGIDVAETLSNLTGKWIKRITADEVEFADGEKVDLKNLDYRLIKPLIWW